MNTDGGGVNRRICDPYTNKSAPVQTTSNESVLAEAFAKSLAVFFRELGLSPPVEPSCPVCSSGISVGINRRAETEETVSENLDDEQLKRELAETIERHEALARAGKLDTFEITGDLIARELAPRLRAILRERGMTQKALAEKLGVSPARISAVLKKPNKMKLDTLRRIADALGVGVREIV